jgi:hypothetical protein
MEYTTGRGLGIACNTLRMLVDCQIVFDFVDCISLFVDCFSLYLLTVRSSLILLTVSVCLLTVLV